MRKTRIEFASKNDVRFDDEFQREAHKAELRARAITQTSQRAIADLSSEIIEALITSGKAKNRKRNEKLAEFQLAVSGFIYDLLKGVANNAARGWISVEFSSGSGSRENTGYRHRRSIREAMKHLGWLQVSPGKQFATKHPFGGAKPAIKPGRTTRMRATNTLLVKLSSFEIDEKNYREHFFVELPKWTIKLRAKSKGYGKNKVRGRDMAISREDEKVIALDKDIQEINHYLIAQEIEKAPFSGYIRQFNNGDVDGFSWNKGGRLYAAFQQLKSNERKAIRINSQPVAEIDVSASYLTILHGLLKEPFDTTRDAYQLDKIDREPVKAFISQTLGLGRLPKRWSLTWDDKFLTAYGYKLSKRYKLAEIRDIVVSHYPVLGTLEELGIDWSDLMFTESEAMLTAMLVLMRHRETPSLLVHDSLIVPESGREFAMEAITMSYIARCGIRPRLKIKSDGESDFKDLDLDEP
jgi:hypothetical protein